LSHGRGSPPLQTLFMLAKVLGRAPGCRGRHRLCRGGCHERPAVCFTTVGLPDSARAGESRSRRAAIRNGGFEFTPGGASPSNLRPPDLRKKAPHSICPTALGIMSATGLVKRERPRARTRPGGTVARRSRTARSRVLPVALHCRQHGFGPLVVPAENAAEASVVERLDVIPVETMLEAVEYLNGVDRRADPRRRDAHGSRIAPPTWPIRRCARPRARQARARDSPPPAATTCS
jgi:predicted ATPase with chaperone activity